MLTGYISLQTEHHLFPMMPTSKLDKVGPTHSPNPSPYPNPNPNPGPKPWPQTLDPEPNSRPRLYQAQPLVRAFFKEHGLLYRESNLVECVKYNIKALEFAHLLKH